MKDKNITKYAKAKHDEILNQLGRINNAIAAIQLYPESEDGYLVIQFTCEEIIKITERLYSRATLAKISRNE